MEKTTLSPPHWSQFASCFLCDVDVSEVHSNLRVLLRVPQSAWVPRSGDLKSPKLLLSSIPAMHQGVEFLQCRNARVLSINFCMSNCGFSSIFKIPWDWQVFAVLFNEISYQFLQSTPSANQDILNTKHHRLGHRMMGSTWLFFRFVFLDPFLHCTVQCFYNAPKPCHHACACKSCQVFVLLAEPRSLGVRQDCFQVVLESELKHFVFCSVAKN